MRIPKRPDSRRDRCSVDDVLLLTQQPLKLEAGCQLQEPGVHALALVERMEPDPLAKHMRIVHALVNLGVGPYGCQA